MNRVVGEVQRQREIIRDALDAHFVEEREIPTCRIIEAKPDLGFLFIEDRERAGFEFHGIADVEIGGRYLDLGAGPPDETAAEDIGV